MPLTEIVSLLLDPLLHVLTTPPTLILIGLVLVIIVVEYLIYQTGSYAKITKNKYFSVKNDTGKYGEYMTYQKLRPLERAGAKFLFNLYVPTEEGSTSEIDILMLCTKGIFVFESKNYSGWIFGRENDRQWYQTLPKGRGKGNMNKEAFYNPVKQNRTHIRNLRTFLNDANLPLHSVIVFSQRCTLKNVTVQSADIAIVQRNEVMDVVQAIGARHSNVLTQEQVRELYAMLLPLTDADEETKRRHIADIQAKKVPTTPSVGVSDEAQFHPTASVKALKGEEIPPADIPAISTEEGAEDAATAPERSNAVKICPRCGAPLVVRKATKGSRAGQTFLGCSAFPKCRYTEAK